MSCNIYISNNRDTYHIAFSTSVGRIHLQCIHEHVIWFLVLLKKENMIYTSLRKRETDGCSKL
jgi:hypothetical protein